MLDYADSQSALNAIKISVGPYRIISKAMVSYSLNVPTTISVLHNFTTYYAIYQIIFNTTAAHLILQLEELIANITITTLLQCI